MLDAELPSSLLFLSLLNPLVQIAERNETCKNGDPGNAKLGTRIPHAQPPSPPPLHESPSANAAYEAQTTPLPPKMNGMSSASVDSTMKAWDAELASELKKLRAELSDAVGDK